MLILFIIVFVNLIGFGIIIPLLPFFGEHFNATPVEVTALMAVYSATQFVTAPLWGFLSDKYGRRPILIFTLAGTVASYIWFALAADLTTLFLSRALAGIMAGSISTAFAYMADITDESNRSKGMGLIGAAFGLGFIAGPAIGGLLAGSDPATTNFQLPSFIAAGFSSAALLGTIVMLKESLSPEIRSQMAQRSTVERWNLCKKTISRSDIATIIILTFLTIFVFAGLEATFAMWSERQFGWGVEQNGYIFAFIGVISAVIQGTLIGPISKRI
ncbi:MAG: MFS transporter, partial [Rhodospirillales bacterium]|nr:MFS transporter [Rhodospirillales bacterium]